MGEAELNMMSGVFITGTDTDVGKTWIGARLTRFLYRQGIPVSPRKPAESGCRIAGADLIPADATAYHLAVNQSVPLDLINAYRYQAALAPDQAAQREGCVLTLEMLHVACQKEVRGIALIEGAGGFYSPIAADGLNADLAQALGLPVLLIAADRLGCLNHILLTLEAIERRGMTTAAVILNQTSTAQDPVLDNLAALKGRISVPALPFPLTTRSGADAVFQQLTDILRTATVDSG